MVLKDAINHLEEELNTKQDWSCVACKEDHEQLLEWLKELQAIKNADSNEALNALENMYFLCTPQLYYDRLDKYNDTIKNYILKAQKQEEDIIQFKEIDNKLNLNGALATGFFYKEQQLVVMPLEEYDKYERQEKILNILKETNFRIELFRNIYEITNKFNYEDYLKVYKLFSEILLLEEKFNLLKEWIK